jgi:hypothetical protein
MDTAGGAGSNTVSSSSATTTGSAVPQGYIGGGVFTPYVAINAYVCGVNISVPGRGEKGEKNKCRQKSAKAKSEGGIRSGGYPFENVSWKCRSIWQ